MRDRLSGLSFLSTRILPVIGLIDAVIAKVPSEGYFTGAPFWELATLVRTLGDENLLASVMDGTLTDGTDSVTVPVESVVPTADMPEQTAETEPDLFRTTADAAKAVGAAATISAAPAPAANVIPPPVVLPKVDVGDGFYF